MLAIVIAATAVVAVPLAARADNSDGDIAETKAVEMPEGAGELIRGEGFIPEGETRNVSPQPTEGEEKMNYTADTIPAVTGLTRQGESRDSILLSWDGIAGVKGYRVYRCDKAKGETDYRLFSTVNAPSLYIRNLEPGSLYGFKVAAFITDGEGEAAQADCATVPEEVDGFKVADQTKSKTTVTWDKHERADGYVMQRCFNGKWEDYQTFDPDTTEFTDEELKGGRAYYYRIIPYRTDSFSDLSGKADTVYTVAGLLGPKDNGSESKLGRVSLDYDHNKYADGYDIYYSKDKKDWEHLADTEKKHYSTSRLEDGETYFFRIYSYKNVDDKKITGGYTELEFVANKEIYDRKIGDTYIEVSLDDQHMWYIVDGDVYLDSDCVTGNYKTMDTPKGYFEIHGKASPCTLKGDDYETHVTYWMPFIGGGWGLHDASWRSKFGGSIYKGDGSHGCVNLPSDIAKKLYAHTEEGTPVIVY